MFLHIVALAAAAAPVSSSASGSSLWGIAVLVVIATVVSELLRKGGKRRKSRKPEADSVRAPEVPPLQFENETYPLAYQLRPSLLTKAERSFYGVLQQVAQGKWTIFAKVRVSDIVTVPRGVAGWQTQFNKVQSKHVDMVICDPSTLRVLAAVELDDASHQQLERQERDSFIAEVFATAKLPLIRVPARQAYTLDSIRGLLSEELGSVEAAVAG